MSDLAGIVDWGEVESFSIDVLTSLCYVIIASVLAVNVLFYADSSITKDISLTSIFPTEPNVWPYCYTDGSQYSECPEDADKPPKDCGQNINFGDINTKLSDPTNSFNFLKGWLSSGSIFLEKLVFKMFCLTKEQYETVNELNDNEDDDNAILSKAFFIARFKQWMNNTSVYHFTKSRYILIQLLTLVIFIRTFFKEKGISDITEPFMIIIGFIIFILLCLYFAFGISFLLTLFAMVVNKTQTEDLKTWGGGILWTIITAGGFGGLVPLIISIVQFIQFFGSFVLYPLTNITKYKEIYAKYIPIVFFVFNIFVIYHAIIMYTNSDNENILALSIIVTVFIIMSLFFGPAIHDAYKNMQTASKST
jgi:hypothetical protein